MWVEMCDFIGVSDSNALTRVCRNLRGLLHKRHQYTDCTTSAIMYQWVKWCGVEWCGVQCSTGFSTHQPLHTLRGGYVDVGF